MALWESCCNPVLQTADPSIRIFLAYLRKITHSQIAAVCLPKEILRIITIDAGFLEKKLSRLSYTSELLCLSSERHGQGLGLPYKNNHIVSIHARSLMDLGKTPIRELLDYCLQTDNADGWTAFVSRIRPTIEGVIAKNLRSWTRANHDLVEDRAQETYAKLFRNQAAALRKFKWLDEDEKAIFHYVKVIARHVVEDFRRSKQGQHSLREETLEDSIGYDASQAEEADCKIQRQQQWRQIEACLQESLSFEPYFARDLSIFRLFYRFGYSARLIAELPEVNLETKAVENILLRMVRTVKSKLQRKDQRTDGHKAL